MPAGPFLVYDARRMTDAALPRPSRFPGWVMPAGLAVLLLAMLLGIVLLAREAGKPDMPPAAGAFQQPPPLNYVAFDVQQAANGVLTLASGSEGATTTVTISPSDRVWLLRPATVADVKPPMVVNVVAIPNEVRNYTIHLLALAPAPAAVDFDAPFIPLADGFAGYETSRDAAERVVASAVLETFDGRNGKTKTSTGGGTLYIDPGAPIRVIAKGAATDIQPGDRVAFQRGADGQPDVSKGVLVLPAAK